MYLSFRGDPAWTTNFIGIERASRVLCELATEADPFIKKKLLRVANNYDDMAATETKRDQAAMKPELYSTVDSCDSN